MSEGKTTSLIQDAIEMLNEMPEDQTLFITGAHSRWLRTLKWDFQRSGLVGIEFITMPEIFNGKLRGRRGRLLIDDVGNLDHRESERLMGEKRILEIKNPRKVK